MHLLEPQPGRRREKQLADGCGNVSSNVAKLRVMIQRPQLSPNRQSPRKTITAAHSLATPFDPTGSSSAGLTPFTIIELWF